MRLLHLSDCRLGNPSHATGDTQRLHALLATLAPLAAAQPFDVILLCGNVVHAAEQDAFAVALEFCQTLLTTLNMKPQQLYVTPGNREVDRTHVTPMHIKRWYPFDTQEALAEVFSDPQIMPLLMAKFAPFNAFAAQAMGREQYTARIYHLIDAPMLTSTPTGRLNVMGLNSCLLAGYDAEWGQLALSTHQTERALAQLNDQAVLSVGFFHHPFAAYTAADHINQTQLRRRLDLIFTGEARDDAAAFVHAVDSKACVIGAGKSVFNTVDVDLSDGQGVLQRYVYAPDQPTWTTGVRHTFVIDALHQQPVKVVAPIKPCPVAAESAAMVYDIFLSYSQNDVDWVQTHLLAPLQRCQRSDGRRLRIFHDCTAIPGGAQWHRTMAQGIQQCQHFLAVYSPAYFASPWCLWTLGLAVLRDATPADPMVLPVRYQAADIPLEYHTIKTLDAASADFLPQLYGALHVQSGQAYAADIHGYQAQEAAVPADPHVHWVHDYLLPQNFTGRLAERRRLTVLLRGAPDPSTQKNATLITVRALGGMGKSCLLRKLLHDVQGETRFRHVLWFSFYEARTDDEARFFHQVLQKLDPAAVADDQILAAPAEESRRLYERLVSFLDREPTLLVLDGLEVIQRTQDKADPAYGRIKPSYAQTTKLLAHLCNPSCSVGLVTSRVTLTDFSGVMGYLEIDLQVMQADMGAEFLQRMGVEGSVDARKRCGALFGGHPLTLKAAGQYMQFKHIAAADVESLTGDWSVFEGFAEGQKLATILHAYRADLSKDQKYFLEMLSLHPRTVTEVNFPVLVADYALSKPFQAQRNPAWVLENIIDPLKRVGLIEVVAQDDDVGYQAHPLMKLAFLSWLNSTQQQQAHARWAQGMEASPDVASSAESVTSLAALQPFVDVVAHYLQAGKPQAAWEIYRGKSVDDKLHDFGDIHRLAALGHEFENRLMQREWQADVAALRYLYNFLSLAAQAQGLDQECIEYCKKAFKVAEQSEDAYSIVVAGSILADLYLNLGDIKQAKPQLLALKPSVAAVRGEAAVSAYNKAQAKLAHYLGEYAAAMTQYQQAPKWDLTYNQVLLECALADVYRRCGQFDQCAQTLDHARKLTEQQHIPVLIPGILQQQIQLALKQHQTDQAREVENQREKRLQAQNRPFIPTGFLLVQEERYDFAIQTMMPLITGEDHTPVNKVQEIEALLVLSQAWFGQGEVEQARDFLQRAQALMTHTGCWLDKDRWEQTQRLLEGGRA